MLKCWVCPKSKQPVKAVYQDSQGDGYCEECFDRFKEKGFKWKYGEPKRLT